MKAVQYSKYGGPEVLEINKNAPNPTAGSRQVLVEVHAVSLNPFDYKLRAGYMKEMIPLQFPFTIGGDFSGVITNLGENVSEFKIGDEVYGQALVLNGGSGAFAEVVASNVANTGHKPKNADHIQAASLPLVGASAIQALEEHIKLKSKPHSAKAASFAEVATKAESRGKQKILIHGGAGGIGSIAIQLSKSLGAYVATTVNGRDMEFVKSLGGDMVIDYKRQKFEDLLKDFDAVFDTVGGETVNKSFKVLKKGGIIVSMLGAPNPKLAKEYGIKAVGQNTRVNNKTLSRLTEFVEKGMVKPQIDKVFPFDKAREAFEYLENDHPRGKVVVKIRTNS